MNTEKQTINKSDIGVIGEQLLNGLDKTAPATHSREDYIAMAEEIAKLKAQLAAGARKANKLGLKVSEKGAVSVTGMGRFPTTLYASQWLKVLGVAEEIKAFIEANKAALSFKD